MVMWPGWYIDEFDKLPKAILNDMPVINVDVLDPDSVKTGLTFSTANCSCEVDEFPAGASVFWFFDYDETHYVLDGEAEFTYSLASTSHTVRKKTKVKKGDFYIVPLGARVTWDVSSDGPLRLFWITQPGIPAKRHGIRTKMARETNA